MEQERSQSFDQKSEMESGIQNGKPVRVLYSLLQIQTAD
jgi:hypothetical protein